MKTFRVIFDQTPIGPMLTADEGKIVSEWIMAGGLDDLAKLIEQRSVEKWWVDDRPK